ncbi:type I glyceraldehyde-3-phosphate dehydrogenase [Candidatus Saccharibacteria bacterium]|nr:type I glyceraldehyde-3-phosphate dehydrogenase [Candidatus Saccharibacteria bacterium]
MMVKVAINGFGRIGRNAFKILQGRKDAEVVAINDITDAATLAHLLKYDSSYGTYDQEVSSNEHAIIVDGKEIPVYAEKDPHNLPWANLGVDVVIESTGFFTKPEDAKAHIDAGAKRVVISAPAKGEGAKTIVLGVNEEAVTPDDLILSNASCTTNCIAPIMKVLEDEFGIEKAMMTTVHSYTGSQRILDAPAKDLREARSAAENIVPTTTGASKAAALTIPSLQGKFNGLSVRVPTPVVSLSDITAVIKRNTTKEELVAFFKKVADEQYYQGIIGVTEEELVSSDFIGDPRSCIVDLPLIDVVGGNMIKVVAWYDNEWGYSNRLVELTVDFGGEN